DVAWAGVGRPRRCAGRRIPSGQRGWMGGGGLPGRSRGHVGAVDSVGYVLPVRLAGNEWTGCGRARACRDGSRNGPDAPAAVIQRCPRAGDQEHGTGVSVMPGGEEKPVRSTVMKPVLLVSFDSVTSCVGSTLSVSSTGWPSAGRAAAGPMSMAQVWATFG